MPLHSLICGVYVCYKSLDCTQKSQTLGIDVLYKKLFYSCRDDACGMKNQFFRVTETRNSTMLTNS